jgi:hypothetical protein
MSLFGNGLKKFEKRWCGKKRKIHKTHEEYHAWESVLLIIFWVPDLGTRNCTIWSNKKKLLKIYLSWLLFNVNVIIQERKLPNRGVRQWPITSKSSEEIPPLRWMFWSIKLLTFLRSSDMWNLYLNCSSLSNAKLSTFDMMETCQRGDGQLILHVKISPGSFDYRSSFNRQTRVASKC